MITHEKSTALQRQRGLLLELLYSAFQQRSTTYDHVMLWGMMRGLGQTLSLNDVIFLVRQLGDRGYLVFQEAKNRITNEISITAIRITASGQDLVEKIGGTKDPAVLIL